jgi:hypothetical protein
MTTLLDKQRSATSKAQSPTRPHWISAFAHRRARADGRALAPTLSKVGDYQRAGVCAPSRHGLRHARTRRYGGLELDPLAPFRRSGPSELDGSVGWNAMIGHIGALMPFWQARRCEQIYHDRRITSWPVPVSRSAHRAGPRKVESYRRMAVCQRCQNAEWIGARDDAGRFSPRPSTDPARSAPVSCPPNTGKSGIPGTHWPRGTGSHHVALTDAWSPTNFFRVPFGTRSRLIPSAAVPRGPPAGACRAAVGIAEGAIMDLVELAGTGVKQLFMTTPLRRPSASRGPGTA